jgi:alkylation response protein AidB-like acyl-CoA dehydrogenase
VQRIYEGTNEINRLLIPGLLLRKGISEKSRELDLKNTTPGSFETERQLLQGMKQIYLTLSDLTVKKFGPEAAHEQEILLTLADMVIQIFALESALLRAEKSSIAATGTRQELYQAVATICTYGAKQQFVNAAEKCVAFIDQNALLKSIENKTMYKANSLLAAKRFIADATSQSEKYIF